MQVGIYDRHSPKVRDVLSSAPRTAVEYGRLAVNPAEKIRLKKRRLNGPKPFLRIEQFFALLALMAEPYATMVYVAVFTALRVSQLIGLKWRNVHENSIMIAERYCGGDWDEPKSAASKGTIPVDDHVIERIHLLKTLTVEVKTGRALHRYPAVKSSGPTDFVFQSVKTGAPMRDNLVLVRHIKPAAELRDVATAGRRGYKGRPRFVAASAGDVYRQLVPESQQKAVRKLTAYVGRPAAVG